MIDFKLPSLGADMDEGTLLEWLVQPGDEVKRGQVVAIVDTSKTAVDVEIWQAGKVHELIVRPGEKIPVGSVLATLLEPGESVPPTRQAPVVQTIKTEARRRVSPAARKEAETLGVDISLLAGTGPDAAVTLEDVRRAATVKPPVQAPVVASTASAAIDRNAEMRKAIGAAMSRSKREIPHYYLSETIPLRQAGAWLAEQNARRPVTTRLLMAVLQLKAVALATRKFPEMNGFWQDGGFKPAPAAHLGVAIALRQGGLLAPAIHNVAEKTLDQLMSDLTDLVKRVRAGTLRSSEMSDPTLTVTNLGEQGVDAVFGVIYPPQVALVGFGKVRERPWTEAGEVHAIPLVVASLAADHRVSDGHRGALFLAEIHELLQHPERL
ncbi:MAG: dihydrolipoamide acetyltransferase family protein [Proteobacteria bacterium]|nr:dihydrolipoamide acetyltransferase family protein [Pseudomonadota bacterium]